MSASVMKIRRGDTFEWRGQLVSETGEVGVLPDELEIAMQIRKGADKELIIDIGKDGDIEKMPALDESGNNLKIMIPAARTASLPVGTYRGDMELRADDYAITLPGPGEPALCFVIEGDVTV